MPVCSDIAPTSRLFFFGLAVFPSDEIPSSDARLSLSRFLFSGFAFLLLRCSSLISSRRWTSSEMSSVPADTGIAFRTSSSLPAIYDSTRFRFCDRPSCRLVDSKSFSGVSGFSTPVLALFFLIGAFDPAVVEFASSTWDVDLGWFCDADDPFFPMQCQLYPAF